MNPRKRAAIDGLYAACAEGQKRLELYRGSQPYRDEIRNLKIRVQEAEDHREHFRRRFENCRELIISLWQFLVEFGPPDVIKELGPVSDGEPFFYDPSGDYQGADTYLCTNWAPAVFFGLDRATRMT